jgi:hypothetical protein
MGTPSAYHDDGYLRCLARPNGSATRWRTVADLTNRFYYFESTTSLNLIWVNALKSRCKFTRRERSKSKFPAKIQASELVDISISGCQVENNRNPNRWRRCRLGLIFRPLHHASTYFGSWQI